MIVYHGINNNSALSIQTSADVTWEEPLNLAILKSHLNKLEWNTITIY